MWGGRGGEFNAAAQRRGETGNDRGDNRTLPPRRSRWEKPQNGSAKEILRPPNGADEADGARQTGAFRVQPARARRAREARRVRQNGGVHIRQEGRAAAVSAVWAGGMFALRRRALRAIYPPSFPRRRESRRAKTGIADAAGTPASAICQLAQAAQAFLMSSLKASRRFSSSMSSRRT